MSHDKVNEPVITDTPAADGSVVSAPETGARSGRLQRQVRLLIRLFQKSGQVFRQVMTSPSIRKHVFSVIRAEGVTGVFRRLRRMRSYLAKIDQTPGFFQVGALSYSAWTQRFDTPSESELADIERAAAGTSVDILLIVATADTGRLQTSLDSLAASHRQTWHGRLVFASHLDPADREAMSAMAARLPQFGTAERRTPGCVILVEAGTQLRPHAMGLLAAEMAHTPKTALIYADEVRGGTPEGHWFKPDYSPLMARSGRLFGPLVALNATHAKAAACAADIARAPADWQTRIVDLAETLPAPAIDHLAHVLSTTENALPSARDVVPPLADLPIVSIIIPTRNFWSVLKPCLDSLKTTDWPADRLDIIVVDNGSDDETTLSQLALREKAGDIRVIRHDHEFNWSELNNVGARHARGSVLLFLNNDVEVIEPGWLRPIVAFACEPQTGAVGCKLLYPDRTIQHGGVVIGIQGVAGHAHLFLGATEGGYNGLANINREVSAVTGACIAVEKRKFDELGGFDEGFKVAFNDIAFCVTLMQSGYRNVYAADAVLLHHESKSRGYDTTPAKIERNRIETISFWHKFHADIRDDRFYSPNLSYRDTYALSYFPRRKPRWAAYANRKPRVLMLSITHAKGHGVPVVLALQAEALVQAGFDVIVAGPQSTNDFPYDGCTFVEIHDPEAAAVVALHYRVDCVVAHTPPFFSTVRWLGGDFPFIAYDYGEPPADWFVDAEARRNVRNEKEICLAMADRVYAISNAIRDESVAAFDGVIPLGNSHLGQWTADAAARRDAIRAALGLQDRFVILNVCRFHAAERRYKGVDRYVETMHIFKTTHPDLAARCTFALCGKGLAKDVKDMEQEGLTIFANVTDAEMADLYIAADAYMNFSQWEGYNLGIGQALAMGLPTFASDIPAHRAFGAPVSNDAQDACEWLAGQIGDAARQRAAKLWTWNEPLAQFVSIVREMDAAKRPPAE